MDRLTYTNQRTERQMTGDLYDDMAKLNSLYEEMMWPNTDELEFVPDYKNDRIIIYNKSRGGENPWIQIHGNN